MTHRGPFQPLLFCDSVIPAAQKPVIKSTLFPQSPIFSFIHRCAPSLVAPHPMPVRETPAVLRSDRDSGFPCPVSAAVLSAGLTEAGSRPRVRNRLVSLSANTAEQLLLQKAYVSWQRLTFAVCC